MRVSPVWTREDSRSLDLEGGVQTLRLRLSEIGGQFNVLPGTWLTHCESMSNFFGHAQDYPIEMGPLPTGGLVSVHLQWLSVFSRPYVCRHAGTTTNTPDPLTIGG